MGEKIRDIKKIHIGNSSLMVELNEGYSASQGRLIHIQNEKFRYLLTEEDFYHLSTMVMRAWSEFDYLKNQRVYCNKIDDFSGKESNSAEIEDVLNTIVLNFTSGSLDYRVIDRYNSTISILVNKEQLHIVDRIMHMINFKHIPHPMGEKYGYRFLYQMHPFLMYRMNNICVELFCELPCRSITSKTWIPLDRAIQRATWDSSEKKDGVIWCDPRSRYIYILCHAIFVDKGFSSHCRDLLSELSFVLLNDSFMNLLSAVFFKYTKNIILKLSNEDYDSIIPDYFTFRNY